MKTFDGFKVIRREGLGTILLCPDCKQEFSSIGYKTKHWHIYLKKRNKYVGVGWHLSHCPEAVYRYMHRKDIVVHEQKSPLCDLLGTD